MKILYKSLSHPSRTPVVPQDRRHLRVMIDSPQTDFYRTDYNSSDPKEEEHHLN